MSELVVAIALGRKGSKGVRGKNTMGIFGRPAYSFPLSAALNSKYVDKTFVSTNHEDIINGAQKLGIGIINRPESLCTDEALFEDGRRQLEHQLGLPWRCNSQCHHLLPNSS